jgi:hypothetical protein
MKLLLLFTLLTFFIITKAVFSPLSNFFPVACQDSDGDCNVENINASDNVFELVDLLTYPFGWINATNFTDSIPEENTIDNATIHVVWKTDVGFGASNINIDYWNGTHWINCAGPFGESGNLIDTTCNVSSLTKEQILNIKVRFRGEDIDGFPNAFAYVDLIKIVVNHSSPPKWDNQTTNISTNFIYTKDSIQLAVQTFDDVGLAYAWLSTNETGEWKNYTDGTYGSPIYLNNLANSWVWANFSWRNNSFLSGNVAWKIYINDTTGKENVTDIKTFYVQFRRLPVACQDSDGDCNVENINASDNVFELVDLLTYPFGWINASDWDLDLPSNTILQSAYLHVVWKTDVGFGASNINIDYWNGTHWINCAGPFSENQMISDTICNISSLSTNQLNNIMVRFRGEDIDGFPNAFAYVDLIYIVANYSFGIPYLEVELIQPNPNFVTNVIQNSTFIVNATVFCRAGACGFVNGTILYNLTSSYPDTPINTTFGDKPFFVNETPALAMKACSNNPLNANDFCNLTWIVNATGNVDTAWKIGVYFNSSDPNVKPNSTSNATVVIVSCTVDFNLTWNSIDFGILLPNTFNNSAPGNLNNTYNITVNPGSCNLDLYIRGTDLVNTTFNSVIKVGNISWSNISSNLNDGFFRLSETNSLIKSNVPEKTNVTTWYWLDAPPVYAGKYNGTIYITGVKR